jgi:excisionase family DNA binding protein
MPVGILGAPNITAGMNVNVCRSMRHSLTTTAGARLPPWAGEVSYAMFMAQLTPRTADALPAAQAQWLQRALDESADVTVFVNGTTVKLPAQATDAVVDMLRRFAHGDAVMVSSSVELLNTSQAAEVAGVSLTYMRRLTDAGTIPVQYRGTHRRIRLSDVLAWLETRTAAPDPGTPEAAPEASGGSTAPAQR